MSLLKKLASETAMYGLPSIVGRFLNYLLVPLYTHLVFQTAEYGVVSDMYAIIAFFIVIFTYRMETAFFRFASNADDPAKVFSTASISIWGTTVMLCTGLILFAQPIANAMQYPDHPDYVIWFALILGFDALSAIPFAKLRLDTKAKQFALIKIINITLNIGGNLFFFLLCPYGIEQGWNWASMVYDPSYAISYVFIANLLASIATFLLLMPVYLKINIEFDKALWNKMVKYSMPLVIAGFAGTVNEVLDRQLLKYLLSSVEDYNLSQMGIYAACYKLAMLMTLFTQAFNYAAEPFFFSNSNRADAKQIYAQVAQAFSFVAIIGFLGITLYIDIFKHFVGVDYREGLGIVPILLLANLCLGMYYNFAIWYKLTDRTHFGAYIALIGAGVTLGLNILLIPSMGYFGSAWATLACYATMSTLCYLIGKRYYPIPYPIGKMLLYLVIALGIYFTSTYTRSSFGEGTMVTFILHTGLLISYLIMIAVIEKDLVKQVLKK